MIDSLKKFSPYLLSLLMINAGSVAFAQEAEEDSSSADEKGFERSSQDKDESSLYKGT